MKSKKNAKNIKFFYIFCGCLLMALTGCNRTEVVYGDETTGSQQAQNIHEEAVSGNLRDSLGIGEEKMWKESVELAGGPADIKVTLDVPDVSKLYTVSVSEYYLTSEDKQRIAECFMDADSLKVDKEMEFTKERIESEIRSNEEIIKAYRTLDFVDERKIAAYEFEIERLKTLLATAPGYNEVSEEVGGYSANHYTGTKGDVEYSIHFYADESRNRSAWFLKTENPSYFFETDSDPEAVGYYNAGFTEQNNHCIMEKEEAEEKAIQLCEELGLPPMTVVLINDLKWFTDDSEFSEYNGYVVRLARSIDGVATDTCTYFDDTLYVEDPTTKLPYSTEYVEVIINDKGILEVSCKGLLTRGELGESVKLLSYSQIQEIFREEMKILDITEPSYWLLTLSYARMRNESNMDEYVYIPVWKLNTVSSWWGMDLRMETVGSGIWINAMDGSRIDPKEAGFAMPINGQDMGDYE